MSSSVKLTPSTITKGSLPEYELIPLISTVGFAPGVPLEITFNPD